MSKDPQNKIRGHERSGGSKAMKTLLVLTAGVFFLSWGAGDSYAAGEVSDIPMGTDMSKVKIEIVDEIYIKQLDAVNATFDMGDEADKYRGLVLTLRIHKPAGEELRLNAQDLCLHYRYGDKSDIAPCSGLSSFSTQKEMDRTMSLFKSNRGSSSTGTSTMKTDVLYVDIFFNYMEPDSSDLHLLVAQPVGAYYKSKGWK